MQDIFTFILLIIGLYFIWWMKRFQVKKTQKKLTPAFRKKILSHIEKIQSKPLDRQIIEYDKVLDKVLENSGYYGTLGEMMKIYGSNFLDENAIWSAHKMRNKIVHEIDFSPSANVLRTHIKTFQREIDFLLKK